MRKWNDAVEVADWLLRYSLDKASPQRLFDALQATGKYGSARLLRLAGEPLGYFKASEHFPVDKASSGTVKTTVRQKRKAK